MKHYPRIDGLRAFAVTGVLVAHCLPASSAIQILPWGNLGVRLFFVISGYLITRILIGAWSAQPTPRRKNVLLSFYGRRFLRIFPPYYALLATYLVAGIGVSSSGLIASACYGFNFLQAVAPAPYYYLGHLWTLCIEEQFYLVWPWVVLLVSPRSLPRVTLGLMIAAPVTRFLLVSMGVGDVAIRNIPMSQFDCLGGGALLAQLHLGLLPGWSGFWKKHVGKLGWTAASLYLASEWLPVFPWQQDLLLNQPAVAVACMAIVQFATNRNTRIWGRVLEFRPLTFIGRISYGVYLYHFLALLVVYKLIRILNYPAWLSPGWSFAGVWGAVTIVIATASWYGFESPILSLKRFFNYKSGRCTPVHDSDNSGPPISRSNV